MSFGVGGANGDAEKLRRLLYVERVPVISSAGSASRHPMQYHCGRVRSVRLRSTAFRPQSLHTAMWHPRQWCRRRRMLNDLVHTPHAGSRPNMSSGARLRRLLSVARDDEGVEAGGCLAGDAGGVNTAPLPLAGDRGGASVAMVMIAHTLALLSSSRLSRHTRRGGTRTPTRAAASSPLRADDADAEWIG